MSNLNLRNITNSFQDVRLAFAPEAAIAFFGGDPDNFNFPRFDLDMALLRVYEDGKPAEVKDFFRFSAQGPAVNEPAPSFARRITHAHDARTAAPASQPQSRFPSRERATSFPAMDQDWDVPAFQRKGQ